MNPLKKYQCYLRWRYTWACVLYSAFLIFFTDVQQTGISEYLVNIWYVNQRERKRESYKLHENLHDFHMHSKPFVEKKWTIPNIVFIILIPGPKTGFFSNCTNILDMCDLYDH